MVVVGLVEPGCSVRTVDDMGIVPSGQLVCRAEGVASHAGGARVDGDEVIGPAATFQHQPGGTEGVGNDAVGPGIDVAFLDFQHALGRGDIPSLAGRTLLESGEHELSAHAAVTDETTGGKGF